MRLRTVTSLIAAVCFTAACGEPVDDAGVADNGIVEDEGLYGGLNTPTVGNVCYATPLDTDNDGLIERTEYDAFGTGAWDAWDLNDDNRIGRDEFTQCWNAGGWTNTPTAYNADTIWSGWDDDADGFLAQDEFFADDEFAEWDVNDNDALELTEWD